MDYRQILASVGTDIVKPRVKTVTPDELVSHARAMKARGYAHSVVSLKALEAYMQGYGILLSGPVGTGKTLFFKLVEREPIEELSFSSVALWKYDRLEEWLNEHRYCDIVLDDVGADKSGGDGARNFGQRYETLQIVLDARLKTDYRTHITTNMGSEALISTYDYRLVDRIYELTKPFVIPPGTVSLRAARPSTAAIRLMHKKREDCINA